jgi:hypothetical protein
MKQMDDWQLLNDYASRNSEEAFRALMDRYANLVLLLRFAAGRQPAHGPASRIVRPQAFADKVICSPARCDRVGKQKPS